MGIYGAWCFMGLTQEVLKELLRYDDN
ncbi:HNH endonuclease, partial [Neisseria gonorrhoeae]